MSEIMGEITRVKLGIPSLEKMYAGSWYDSDLPLPEVRSKLDTVVSSTPYPVAAYSIVFPVT